MGARTVRTFPAVRLPPEAQARLDAWSRARRAHSEGRGPEPLRCDVEGCPSPAGYCACVRSEVA
jgi:hypothetical protein